MLPALGGREGGRERWRLGVWKHTVSVLARLPHGTGIVHVPLTLCFPFGGFAM